MTERRPTAPAEPSRVGRWLPPLTTLLLLLAGWEGYVRAAGVPPYILPAPSRIVAALVDDAAILLPALGVTLAIAAAALALAALGGALLAVLFDRSPAISRSLYPIAVVLQVTPVIAIAPLIFIYVDSDLVGLLLCAWLVAFFPVLSNATLGLASADPGLHDVLTVYGASRWQRLRVLLLPAALPAYLAGLRIAGGLALIGAVVAEYVGGTAGIGSGLAFRILEAGYRLDIPRMFAALVLLAGAGVAVYGGLALLTRLLLRRRYGQAEDVGRGRRVQP